MILDASQANMSTSMPMGTKSEAVNLIKTVLVQAASLLVKHVQPL